MTLKSALEDLLGTTLAGVAGIAGKMEYVASLRDPASGAYTHWGLTRAYGEAAAQLGGGSARHFSSVLQALSILVSSPTKNPSGPTPPA
jgi:hypothetical protein